MVIWTVQRNLLHFLRAKYIFCKNISKNLYTSISESLSIQLNHFPVTTRHIRWHAIEMAFVWRQINKKLQPVICKPINITENKNSVYNVCNKALWQRQLLLFRASRLTYMYFYRCGNPGAATKSCCNQLKLTEIGCQRWK